MELTTTVTSTWASEEDQLNPAVTSDRRVLLTRLISEGKTDDIHNRIEPHITKRSFINEEAAQEFIQGLQEICAAHEVTPPTCVID